MRPLALVAALALAAPALAQAHSPFPPGVYAPGPPAPAEARFVFGADGTVVVGVEGQAYARGTYEATAGHLVLTLAAEEADGCGTPEQASGIYAWALDGDALTLTVVDDPCEDRGEALAEATWTRLDEEASAALAASAVHGAFPVGAYRPGPPAPETARLVFDADGAFRAMTGARVEAAGTFRATADHLVLTFGDDAAGCTAPADRTGIYAWALDAGALALTLVDDACADRAEALTSVIFTPVDGE